MNLPTIFRDGILARAASGMRHGYDASSAREPLAARFYDARHAVPRDLHAVVRNRRLAAMALGYAMPAALDFGITVPAGNDAVVQRPYCVMLHATSRADKLWPEQAWTQLGGALVRQGRVVMGAPPVIEDAAPANAGTLIPSTDGEITDANPE